MLSGNATPFQLATENRDGIVHYSTLPMIAGTAAAGMDAEVVELLVLRRSPTSPFLVGGLAKARMRRSRANSARRAPAAAPPASTRSVSSAQRSVIAFNSQSSIGATSLALNLRDRAGWQPWP